METVLYFQSTSLSFVGFVFVLRHREAVVAHAQKGKQTRFNYLLSAPLYVRVSPSTRHGARTSENKLATFGIIMMWSTWAETYMTNNIKLSQRGRHCPLSCKELEFISSKQECRQDSARANIARGGRLRIVAVPTNGGSWPDWLGGGPFPFCVRQRVLIASQYGRAPGALFYVAAQMGIPTWRAGLSLGARGNGRTPWSMADHTE